MDLAVTIIAWIVFVAAVINIISQPWMLLGRNKYAKTTPWLSVLQMAGMSGVIVLVGRCLGWW